MGESGADIGEWGANATLVKDIFRILLNTATVELDFPIHRKIYAVPDSGSKILIFDPETHQVHGVDVRGVTQNYGPEHAGKKWRDAVALDGKIYGIPHSALDILVFDPATGQVSSVPLPAAYRGTTRRWLKLELVV